jgi:hypothetical protein
LKGKSEIPLKLGAAKGKWRQKRKIRSKMKEKVIKGGG